MLERHMIGTDITTWRRQRRMSQTTLAERLGVARNTVNRWENERAPIPQDLGAKLDKLAITSDPAPYKKLPDHITPINTPNLYVKYRGRYAHRGIHPRMLLSTGFLVAPDVVEDADGRLPYSLLSDPRYLEAKERWIASGRKIANDTL